MGEMQPQHPGLFEEYRSLRQEILGYQRDSLVILAFSATATGTLLVIGFQFSLRWVLAAVPALAWASALLQFQRLQSTYLLGYYISVFLEGDATGLMWETRRKKMNEHGEVEYRWASFKVAVMVPLILIHVAGMVGVALHCDELWAVLIDALAMLLLGWEVFMLVKATNVSKARRRMIELARAERQG